MSEGASLTSFAAEIGVCRATINVWMDAEPEFLEAVRKGKAKCAAWWEKQARNVAQGYGGPGAGGMIQFGLVNMSGDDWKAKQEVNITSRSTVKIDPDMKPEDAAKAYQDLMDDD